VAHPPGWWVFVSAQPTNTDLDASDGWFAGFSELAGLDLPAMSAQTAQQVRDRLVSRDFDAWSRGAPGRSPTLLSGRSRRGCMFRRRQHHDRSIIQVNWPTTPLAGSTSVRRSISRLRQCEELTDARLVGWSYGGMIIPGMADRVPEQLARLVYLDASVPVDGENGYDAELASEGVCAGDRAAARPRACPATVSWIPMWRASAMARCGFDNQE
jgi:pimeloyl-ACP methyl ester carboxylesterase